MKSNKEVINKTQYKLVALIYVLVAVGIAMCYYFAGVSAGKAQEQKTIQSQIHQCQYAPTPITIGDTLYLVRWYPLDY